MSRPWASRGSLAGRPLNERNTTNTASQTMCVFGQYTYIYIYIMNPLGLPMEHKAHSQLTGGPRATRRRRTYTGQATRRLFMDCMRSAYVLPMC